MARTVTEIQEEIQKLQQEIVDLQKDCPHGVYELCMYSWRIGSAYPSRLCKECKLPLVGITDEEADKARKDAHYPSVQTNTDCTVILGDGTIGTTYTVAVGEVKSE